MQAELKHRIETLLKEVQLYTDPLASNLLDRTDCREMVLKLNQAMQELLDYESQIEREREDAARRLTRRLSLTPQTLPA